MSVYLLGEDGLKRCTTYGLGRLKKTDFLLIAQFVKIWRLPALKSCTFSAKMGIKGVNIRCLHAGTRSRKPEAISLRAGA